MASPSLFHFFFLIPMLLMIINPSHSSRVTQEDPNNKVNVSVYYESLCPACESYIAFDIAHILKDEELRSIVNIHLVPYGNAKTLNNGSVECQHGSDECFFNTIEACALDIKPLATSFQFIKCVEAFLLLDEGNYDKKLILGSCDNKDDRLQPELMICYLSGHGDQLIKSYGRETGALIPPHEFVPWVTVNGNPLRDEKDYLIKYICDAYKGQQKIKACSNVHVASSLTEKKRSTQTVCHANVDSGASIITM